MWVKKSKDELQEDQKARNKIALKYGVWTFIASISLLILKDKYIGTGGKGMPWEKPISWTEINDNITFYIGFSTLAAIVFYYIRRRIKSNTQICDKCGKTRSKEKKPGCQCGGGFIDIDLMKRVD